MVEKLASKFLRKNYEKDVRFKALSRNIKHCKGISVDRLLNKFI